MFGWWAARYLTKSSESSMGRVRASGSDGSLMQRAISTPSQMPLLSRFSMVGRTSLSLDPILSHALLMQNPGFMRRARLNRSPSVSTHHVSHWLYFF